MKKSITFLLSLAIVAFSTGLYAQGKGGGRGPSVSQGHGSAGSSAHGPSGTKGKSTSAGKQGTSSNGNATKTTWETRLTERLQSDPAFQTRIQTLLPAGMDPATAASGFKNQGQFIAALHVSQNLNIPFDQLKAKMTGVPLPTTSTTQTTTPTTTQPSTTEPMSLGKAIQELRPTLTEAQVTAAAKQAQSQATTTQKTTTPTT